MSPLKSYVNLVILYELYIKVYLRFLNFKDLRFTAIFYCHFSVIISHYHITWEQERVQNCSWLENKLGNYGFIVCISQEYFDI